MNVKKRPSKRILAALLALLMVLTMGQTGMIGAFAAEQGYTVTVTDSETGTPVEGATLTVISAKDVTDFDVVKADETFTDDDNDGDIEIAAIAEYLESDPAAEISFSFTVSAKDYQTSDEQFVIVNSENLEDEFSVALKQNPTVTVNVADEDSANISAYLLADKDDNEGTEINISDDTADFVPVGSFVKFEIQDKSYYITEITATNGGEKADPVISEEITYVYEITDDFVLNVVYQAETYTLKVTYNEKEGTVVPDNSVTGDLKGEVTVSKSEIETVFTITPNSQYKISGIFFNDANKENNLAPTNVEDCEKSYVFSIDNTSIAADSRNTLEITFELRTFTITISEVTEGRGTVTVCDENGNIEPSGNNPQSYEVLSGTNITLNFEGKAGYKLVNLTSDDSDPNNQQLFSKVVDEKYTFSVDKDITFTADFNEINSELLVGIPLDSIFVVEGAVLVDGVYYSSNDSVTITPKETIIYNGETILENVSIADLFFDGEFHEIKFRPITIDKDTKITPLQIYGGDWFSKQWFSCDSNAVMEIKFDNARPEITSIDVNQDDYFNTSQTAYINVQEDLSGVKSVIVTNDYNDDEKVTCSPNDEGAYEFAVPVRNDYTGPITYTVTATDNVGNSSTKEFTVKNDTVAPELTYVNFGEENTSAFAHFLNKISFGKWFNEKLTLTITATDPKYDSDDQNSSAGFDGVKSKAIVTFYDESSEEIKSYGNDEENKIIIDESGKATLSVPSSDFNGVFKGTVKVKIYDSLANASDAILVTTANSNILSDDSPVIMIESNLPEVNINPSSADSENGVDYTVDGKTIYNGEVSFAIDMKDEDSGLYEYRIAFVKSVPPTENDLFNENNIIGIVSEKTDLTNQGDILTELPFKDNQSIISDPDYINSDGNYILAVEVTDNSGNVATDTCTVYKDTTTPVITNFEFNTEDGSVSEEDTKTAVEVTDYGFYFKKDVTVTISANDPVVSNEIASGVQSITYKIDGIDAQGNSYTQEETVNVQDDTTSFSIEVAKGFKGQIYAFATDNVNNSGSYVHPDGTVVESLDKHSESSSIVITAPRAAGTQNNAYSYKYDLNENAVTDTELSYPDNTVQVPLYNSDPTFNVTVSDSYSGIRNVKWTVIEGGTSTSKEISVDNTGKITNNTDAQWSIPNDTMDANLVTQITGSIPVTGNYNNMVLVVELTDRAGNVSYDYYTFGIDKTAPVISVTYNNNNADQRSGNTYFDANRTATIVIEERNFNSQNVVVNVTKDGRSYPVSLSWRNENGTANNGDGTRHITSITYDSDGDYTFSVSYTDRAQNRNNGVNYGNSVAPTAFTVDKTAPVISVTYNNNNAQNGHYFRSDRTATIVITEHNFDVNRVVFTRTAALNGSNITIPSVSWNNNGDVHTATIHYTADGDYTFNIAMDDMAGNTNNGVDYGASVAANSFTVDKTQPTVELREGNNGEHGFIDTNQYNAEVIPSIFTNDNNYDQNGITVKLTKIARASNGDAIDVTSEYIKNMPQKGQSIDNDTFRADNGVYDRDDDGIYTLSVSMRDMAGNSYSKTAVFTVNRYGSVYVFDGSLPELRNGYSNTVDSDLIIREYNPSAIKSDEDSLILQLTKDGSELSNVNYRVNGDNSSTGVSGWYEREYIIPRDTFYTTENVTDANGNTVQQQKLIDGIYNLYISTEDSADNLSETTENNTPVTTSDGTQFESSKVSFTLDATKPQIVNVDSSDIEIGKDTNQLIVNAEKLTLNVEISDNIAIDTVEVHKGINDSNIVTYNMDDLVSGKAEISDATADNYMELTCNVTVENGFNEDEIFFVVKDKAGNVINTSAENSDENTAYDLGAFRFLNNVTVDTNPFVLWFANKPLFWGSIGALAAILIGVFLIIFFKKRKKNDDEEQAES